MTTENKSKQKRGRPKKVQSKPVVEVKTEKIEPEVELNEVFNSNIYIKYNNVIQVELFINNSTCFRKIKIIIILSH